MKPIPDKKVKQILADYVEIQNYREVGRKHKVAEGTVRAIVKRNPEFTQRCAEKKEQVAADVLAHMEEKKGEVNELLDKYLKAMGVSETIGKANVVQLATAFGILVDKFTATGQKPADMSLQQAYLDVIRGGNGATNGGGRS